VQAGCWAHLTEANIQQLVAAGCGFKADWTADAFEAYTSGRIFGDSEPAQAKARARQALGSTGTWATGVKHGGMSANARSARAFYELDSGQYNKNCARQANLKALGVEREFLNLLRYASLLAFEIPALRQLLQRMGITGITVVERVRGAPADAGVVLQLADGSALFALLEVKVASLPRVDTLWHGNQEVQYARMLGGDHYPSFGLIERVGGVGIVMCTTPSHPGTTRAAITAGADVAVWIRCPEFVPSQGIGGVAAAAGAGPSGAGPSGAGPSGDGELPKMHRAQASSPRAQASSPRGPGGGGRAAPGGGGRAAPSEEEEEEEEEGEDV